jgi:hypothetical protein
MPRAAALQIRVLVYAALTRVMIRHEERFARQRLPFPMGKRR